MSFEAITLKAAENNVAKQINDRGIKICKYVKQCRHVIYVIISKGTFLLSKSSVEWLCINRKTLQM